MFGYAMSTGDCDERNAELVVLMSISIRFSADVATPVPS